MLSPEEIRAIEHETTLFPHKKAACIEALKIVQRRHRWVSDEHIHDIAKLLDMTADELDSVATFYNLVFRKPVGRHVILICDSISCWVMGYDPILKHLQKKYEMKLSETTADDRFTLLTIPCLGTCDHAPALMIDDDLHRDLTPEMLDQVLEKYT